MDSMSIQNNSKNNNFTGKQINYKPERFKVLGWEKKNLYYIFWLTYRQIILIVAVTYSKLEYRSNMGES